MYRWVIALAALLAADAARADWLEASSPHFVVYADDSERDIRRFSEQLERYHDAMTVVTGQTLPPPSPSNRVTVFVVKSEREIQRLAGSRVIAGFYIPRAGGSVAFVRILLGRALPLGRGPLDGSAGAAELPAAGLCGASHGRGTARSRPLREAPARWLRRVLREELGALSLPDVRAGAARPAEQLC